jgi:hypothetical protein
MGKKRTESRAGSMTESMVESRAEEGYRIEYGVQSTDYGVRAGPARDS